MLDTNVLIFYAIFGSGTIARVVEDVALNHELILPTYVIDEFRACAWQGGGRQGRSL